MNEKEFQALRQELISGNTQSLKFIFEKYAEYCIKNLRKQKGCSLELAEDILMDAILNFRDRVVENKLSEVRNVRNYLYTTCTNMHKAQISKQTKNRNKAYEIQNTLYANYDQDHLSKEILQQDQEEFKRISKETFAELNNTCQEVLRYFYVHNLSMEEIATRLGYSGANVAKTTKARCLKKWLEAVKKQQTKGKK